MYEKLQEELYYIKTLNKNIKDLFDETIKHFKKLVEEDCNKISNVKNLSS